MEPTIPGVNLLAQLLDASSLRHRVIAQNVANVNTPGYQRQVVTFETDLAKALATPQAETPALKPRVETAEGPARGDGNTVDIDREMNDLSRNALVYQAAAQIIASRVAAMRSAISGR